MARWWRHPSIRRWPMTREARKLTRSKPATSGVLFWGSEGGVITGVSGRAGKLDGDSAAQRSMAVDNERGCTWGSAILGAVETRAAVTQCLMGMGPALGIGHLAGGPWPTKSRPNFHS
jgi:hypothetical protein